MLIIGNLTLESIFCLAPLAGYTGLPFRLTIRELGGLGLATTELVSARSLIEGQKRALELIETRPEDRPLAVQLFGAVPEEMRDAAAFVESLGVDVIDINMGCPAPKVCRTGAGVALMGAFEKAVELAATVVRAVRIPVTVKMRLGPDRENIVAPLLARFLEEVGVAAVCVHGRTGDQGYSGEVSLEGIRRVVDTVKRIPVIGNGDVTTPEAAFTMMRLTGCASVSIGRGAFYNPWIFIQSEQYFWTGRYQSPPSFDDRIAFMARHLDRMVEIYGEKRGCMMFRKIAHMYARQLGPSSFFKEQVCKLTTRAQFDEIVEQYRRWRQAFLDERGELLPRYRPRPLTPSYCKGHGTPETDA
ncbi:MAG: tRNA dihydrouridine synthase DusB [Verrucomicrobiae bacterium]|nr:tRNA dihydrouridine synthase DusB [Verrucomicrobiae bacterium]